MTTDEIEINLLILKCFIWICVAFAVFLPLKMILESPSETDESLEGHYQIQRSKVINHPEYSKPVLLTEYGWAKRGHETYWYEKKITQIGEANE